MRGSELHKLIYTDTANGQCRMNQNCPTATTRQIKSIRVREKTANFLTHLLSD